MKKNNIVISEKAKAALERRNNAEVALLELLSGEELELLNEMIDAWVEYDDCLNGTAMIFAVPFSIFFSA